MTYLLDELNSFLESDDELQREEHIISAGRDTPAPQMMPDGTWKIPGTEKPFSSQTEAYAAIGRFSKYFQQNQAALLIHGMSYGEYMGGSFDRDEPPLVQTNEGKYKFVDGKREYHSEEAAKNAFNGYQKYLRKTPTE